MKFVGLFIASLVFGANISSISAWVGKCDIDIISSYGCLSCNQFPYIIYQPSNIEAGGLTPFESNCTFKRNFLTCNPGTSHLEAETIREG